MLSGPPSDGEVFQAGYHDRSPVSGDQLQVSAVLLMSSSLIPLFRHQRLI